MLFSNLHKLFNDQVLPRLLQDLSAPAVSVTATAGRAALPVSQKRCSDFWKYHGSLKLYNNNK